MRLLDEIFLAFDDLVKEAAGALKIETIAGVYLVASNGEWALCSKRQWRIMVGHSIEGEGEPRGPQPLFLAQSQSAPRCH